MITKWLEFNIICDICGIDGCSNIKADWHPDTYNCKDWDTVIPLFHKGSRQIRRYAKGFDWIYKNNKDICPKCQKKQKGN